MTRRITLQLGSTTTETHCGDCPSHNGRCDIFPLQFDYERCDECRDAEIKDELLDEIARLRAEVERCHSRLEIDHSFVFSRDPEVADLVRVDIPYESRELSDDMDGIACRDLTIRSMEEETKELDGELSVARAELERSQSEHRHTMHVMDGMQEEIAKLRAARLRPETVETIRMAIDTMRQMSDTDEEDEAMADLDRCYPEEE